MEKETLSSTPQKSQSGRRTWLIIAIIVLVLVLCCCLLVFAGVLLFRSGWVSRTLVPELPTLPTATAAPMEPVLPTLPTFPVMTKAPVVPDAPTQAVATDIPVVPGMDVSNFLDPEVDPIWGQTRLQRDYTPDPRVIGVGADGVFDLSLFGLDCGFTTHAPTYAFHLGGGASDGFLRIYFVPDGEVAATLIVHTPGQEYLCGKQSPTGSAAGPMVDLEFAASGKYAIWVGVQESGASVLGMLNITQSSKNKP